MSELPRIGITEEMIGPSQPDLLQQIQRRQMDAFIRHERAELESRCGAEIAWAAYPPIPGDDPAEYAPYWSRLSDVVTDESECEEIVASWLSGRRFHGVTDTQEDK